MARVPRKQVISPLEQATVHCVQRCVRQGFLLANSLDDPSFPSRKRWVEDQLSHIVRYFAIDCTNCSILDSHLHLMLRNRPDLVEKMTDLQVAERWLNLYGGEYATKRRRKRKGKLPPGPDPERFVPTPEEILTFSKNKKKIAEARLRLSDVSWFMRSLSQPIACWINQADGVTGRFWDGRFKLTKLLDEAAILACALYIDLNTVRADIHITLESTEFTTAIYRVAQAREKQSMREELAQNLSLDTLMKDILERYGFVAPLELEKNLLDEVISSPPGRRPSNKGFLNISLEAYVELLHWNGSQVRPDKRGRITQALEVSLRSLGINLERWADSVRGFTTLFFGLAGSQEVVAQEQKRLKLPSRKKCRAHKIGIYN